MPLFHLSILEIKVLNAASEFDENVCIHKQEKVYISYINHRYIRALTATQ
jgi:hypothetical protein